jgi:hypothetical protein
MAQSAIVPQGSDHPHRSNEMGDSGNLVGRIERLELANSRLRVAIVAMLAGSSIFLGLGAASKDDVKVLDAERFILRGKGGKIIAELDSGPFDHDPQLALWSNDGRYRMTIGTTSINFGVRDEESVKINAPFKSRINLRFNDENEFFAKVREPQ